MKFKALFLHMPEIYVPEVYNQYTTTGVRAAIVVTWPIARLTVPSNVRKHVGHDDGMDRGGTSAHSQHF